jgi:hypothetical protein
MSSATSFSSRSSPWRLRPLLRPRHSTVLLPMVRHRRATQPLALRRLGLPPALHLMPLWPLVRLPTPAEVVVPARATAGKPAPPGVVPPAGVAAMRDRHSTTPGAGPSPCGRARLRVPPALLNAPPYDVPPLTPPHFPPPGTSTPTPLSPLAGGWDPAALVAAFSTMVIHHPRPTGFSRLWCVLPHHLQHSHVILLIPPPSLLDCCWKRFHSVGHLGTCLGSPRTVLSQQRSRSSSHYSQPSLCSSVHH